MADFVQNTNVKSAVRTLADPIADVASFDAKVVGRASDTFDTMDSYTAGISARLADATTSTAHGGTAVHDDANDTYSATLRCHDPNGELYYVTFSRDQVTLTSYSDDAIRTKVETWADTVAALA